MKIAPTREERTRAHPLQQPALTRRPAAPQPGDHGEHEHPDADHDVDPGEQAAAGAEGLARRLEEDSPATPTATRTAAEPGDERSGPGQRAVGRGQAQNDDPDHGRVRRRGQHQRQDLRQQIEHGPSSTRSARAYPWRDAGHGLNPGTEAILLIRPDEHRGARARLDRRPGRATRSRSAPTPSARSSAGRRRPPGGAEPAADRVLARGHRDLAVPGRAEPARRARLVARPGAHRLALVPGDARPPGRRPRLPLGAAADGASPGARGPT